MTGNYLDNWIKFWEIYSYNQMDSEGCELYINRYSS